MVLYPGCNNFRRWLLLELRRLGVILSQPLIRYEWENNVLMTAYIVPALTDVAGYCRVVVRHGRIENPKEDYERDLIRKVRLWREVGMMGSRGQLLCIEADLADLGLEMRECQPMMAGMVWHFEGEDAQAACSANC